MADGDGAFFKRNDEQVFDEAAGVKVAIETRDDAHGVFRVVGDLVEVQVVGRNQLFAQEMFADVFVPRFPIRATGSIHQDERHETALAGLHQSERFEAFVHRAEAAGEKDDGVGVANEDQFAREEVFERDELLVFVDDRVGDCSHGRRMLTPKLFSGPAPSWPACMMPGPAPVMTM